MIKIKFEELFTFENIYRAHMQGCIGKRKKRSIVRFEIKVLQNVAEIFEHAHSGKYRPVSRYHRFVVFEPKKREIQTLPYRERIMQHVLCDNILAPYFTARAVADNCVCQIGKGTHYALRRFEKMLRAYTRKNGQNGFILKCDILKYFPSLAHRQLRKMFADEFKDQRLRTLVTQIIESCHTEPEFLAKYDIPPIDEGNGKTNRGVPIGNQTSQIFGMFYLNPVDRLIKEKLRIKIYSRYMDDFILVHRDKKLIWQAKTAIEKAVAALDLKLNRKTQIFPLKQGVEYLGFRYRILPTGKVLKTVKKVTTARFRRRARIMNHAHARGQIETKTVLQSLSSTHGHFSHGNCYQIENRLLGLIKVPLRSTSKNRARLIRMLRRRK